jgi:hypothetical protein
MKADKASQTAQYMALFGAPETTQPAFTQQFVTGSYIISLVFINRF